METYSPKPGDVDSKWYVVDAEGKVLGRLACETAKLLRGKHKPEYAPHSNLGDHVIIVNAEKVKTTGKKSIQKEYRRHTSWPRGLRVIIYRDLQKKHPERIIRMAVQGMLPRNRLGRAMARKLRVYAGPVHPHQAQKPEIIEIKA
ncbi:MAG: 50S ribosomal protein L13 [Candidatus Lindowbacteria bacterium]|nr:50S ribosomal protein L13 [Candidatus Lindowbacteria bacterium]